MLRFSVTLQLLRFIVVTIVTIPHKDLINPDWRPTNPGFIFKTPTGESFSQLAQGSYFRTQARMCNDFATICNDLQRFATCKTCIQEKQVVTLKR